MSEPTLTDEQRETLAAAIKDSFYEARDQGRTMHQAAEDPRIGAVVAAMLADERAARAMWELAATVLADEADSWKKRAKAAEAKVRDLTAGIGALVDEWEHPAEVYALRMSAGPRLRALVDDPAAALAEVRAEARQEGAGYRVEAWDRGYAIGWRERDRQARAEAEGAGR